MITLYDYYRSSASYRVRLALNIKQVSYEKHEIHLVKGQQRSEAYLAANPQGLVPALSTPEGVLTQSLNIIDYLEHKYPTPKLYPEDLKARALVQSFSLNIACDIHPLNNLRVLQYLEQNLGLTTEQKMQWYHHWIQQGFSSLEAWLKLNRSQNYCYGDSPTIADICLIPQVYNALRFECPMQAFPLIHSVYEYCMQQDAFIQAAPE